jgi:hypothetical protein
LLTGHTKKLIPQSKTVTVTISLYSLGRVLRFSNLLTAPPPTTAKLAILCFKLQKQTDKHTNKHELWFQRHRETMLGSFCILFSPELLANCHHFMLTL